MGTKCTLMSRWAWTFFQTLRGGNKMGCLIHWDWCHRDSSCCSSKGLCGLDWFNSFRFIHLKESRTTGLRMGNCPKHQAEEDNSSKAAWPQPPPL